jgi:hypothetical protein
LNPADYQDDLFTASLPYNGSSGWSGTDTSKTRADTLDKSGTTKQSQQAVLHLMELQGPHGVTWHEVAEHQKCHHGTASGLLSNLHKDGRIARLLDRRNNCRIYVLHKYINGRATDEQGRKSKACPNCGHAL